MNNQKKFKQILLMYSNHNPSAEHLKNLSSIAPHIKIVVAQDEDNAITEVKNSEVIFGHRYLKQCLPHAEKLQWVQSSSSGIDHLPSEELAQKNILLTRVMVSGEAIARHGVTLAWAITRCLPMAYERQKAKMWDISFPWLPFPRKAIVFGTGNIGSALGKMLKNEGIEVTGVKRHLTQESLPEFDHLCDHNSWREKLPQMDWCFLALPYTKETHHFFDETALLALPSHGVLINVSRGKTLVTKDLVKVLNQGHLGGAGLDVIDPQPLPEGDPIWHTPRLLITPYVASRYLERWQKVESFIEQQLIRFMENQPLLNLVNS
jgi:phosphoglycerate dehydrogenase-like enzyme